MISVTLIDKKRNFGLDVVRAAAIFMVLVNHIANYFISFPVSTLIGDISGMYGVEIFFVLSGYLIGKIFFTGLLTTPSRSLVKKFYIRRWLRTLPLYYFVLIILVLLAFIAYRTHPFFLWHIFFIQNFFPKSLLFFGVSWTLAIEEWFYFLLPLVAFLPFIKNRPPRKQLLGIAIVTGILLLIRTIYVMVFPVNFDDIRKGIPFRFDSLFIGVLFAGIKLHTPRIYHELKRPLHALVFAIFFVLYLTFMTALYKHKLLDSIMFVKIFSLFFGSGLIALLLPYLESSMFLNYKLAKIPFIYKIITWLSILSYSIYLTHVAIFEAIIAIFGKKVSHFILVLPALFIVCLISLLTYLFIERPGMNMRSVAEKKIG